MRVQSLGQEDPLETGMATHPSILSWRIPWTEEPGGQQSIGSQRAGHNWSNLACCHAPGFGDDCSKDSYSSPMKMKRNESHSVVSNTCDPVDCSSWSSSVHGILQARTLEWVLCPWDPPGKNTGVGCHFLLQGIFPIQESNLSLLHCRQILYWLSYEGSLSYSFYY